MKNSLLPKRWTKDRRACAGSLRHAIVALCTETVRADGNYCEREAAFLRLLRDTWKLSPQSCYP